VTNAIIGFARESRYPGSSRGFGVLYFRMKIKQLKEIIERVDDETELFIAPLKKVRNLGNLSQSDEIVFSGIDEEVEVADLDRKCSIRLVMICEVVDDEKKFCLLGFDELYDVLGDDELLIDD
jgi:hypothetical protein